jgi:hypothetical protein
MKTKQQKKQQNYFGVYLLMGLRAINSLKTGALKSHAVVHLHNDDDNDSSAD